MNRTAGLSRELLFLGVLLLFTTFIGYAIQLYLSSELDENTQDIDRDRVTYFGPFGVRLFGLR